MPPVSSARPVRQSGSSARTTIARRDSGVTRRRHAIAAAAVTAYRRALMGRGTNGSLDIVRFGGDGQRTADSGQRTLEAGSPAVRCLLSAVYSGVCRLLLQDLFIPIFGRGVGGDGRRYETSFT